MNDVSVYNIVFLSSQYTVDFAKYRSYTNVT